MDKISQLILVGLLVGTPTVEEPKAQRESTEEPQRATRACREGHEWGTVTYRREGKVYKMCANCPAVEEWK